MQQIETWLSNDQSVNDLFFVFLSLERTKDSIPND